MLQAALHWKKTMVSKGREARGHQQLIWIVAVMSLSPSCREDKEAWPEADHDTGPGGEARADGLDGDVEPSDFEVLDGADLLGSEPEPDVLSPARAVLLAGASEMVFDSETITLTLMRSGVTFARLDRDGLAFGRVDALDPALSYDPWYLYPASGATDFVEPPSGLAFLAPDSAEIVTSDPEGFLVFLRYPEGLVVTLRVAVRAEDRFEFRLAPQTGGPPLAYVRLRVHGSPEEGLYGLGAWHDHVNHRGRTRAMQIEVDLESESANNEGHVRIPLLIGSSGWGLFVDSLAGMVFDVTTQADDLIEVTVGTGEATRDGLSFYLLTAEHALDITKHYYDLTGAFRLPAPWALGPWVWRDEGVDQAKVIADLEAIRDHDLAASGYWIDRPYASAVNSFDFEPSDYDDPAAMVARANALGFRMALWHTPYVDPKDKDSRPFYDIAKERGYFPPLIGVIFDKWGPLVDFTNPEAYAWWQGLLGYYKDIGIEGYKLDYAEEVVLGAFGRRTPWLFFDKSDERTMHHLYQWWYHRVYAEMLPEGGGFLLCRTATIGDQVHGPIIWPGDLDATFWPHGHVFLKDGYPKKAVGGLPASMIYGLSLGPSGFPFYGADTGGYIHAPPDKELFTRWFQQTALSSVMQVGNGASTVPWELGGPDLYDEEMLDWYRTYARLHLRLWPYEWSYAVAISQTGRPIQRPFGLQYPEMGEHPWDLYFFGDDLLVAPVMERGAREKVVIFPPGRWVDFWDGSAWEGPLKETVPAPLWKLPLYLREGGLVPMLRPTIDSLAPTAEPDRVDSYATTPGVLYVRVFPGAASDLQVFDGTRVEQAREGPILRLGFYGGSEFREGAVFEVYDIAAPPDEVTMDGHTVILLACQEDLASLDFGWCHDADLVPPLRIRVPDGSHSVMAIWFK